MTQNLKSYRSGTATAANTSATRFGDVPSRLVVLQAPSGNTSDVTILGVDGSGTIDTNGLTLTKGGSPVTLWCDNLNCLAFKLGTANDTVQYLVGR